jgi:hypothetical protein
MCYSACRLTRPSRTRTLTLALTLPLTLQAHALLSVVHVWRQQQELGLVQGQAQPTPGLPLTLIGWQVRALIGI